jgi:hypothetical protein
LPFTPSLSEGTTLLTPKTANPTSIIHSQIGRR